MILRQNLWLAFLLLVFLTLFYRMMSGKFPSRRVWIAIFLVIGTTLLVFPRWRRIFCISGYKEHYLNATPSSPFTSTKKEPIDVVYTWVDGSDKKWQSIRQEIQQKSKPGRLAASSNRWRDNNELLYSLRSLCQNMDWIRNIYLVTGLGQRPKWLKDHPRLKVIDHLKIIPKKYLPTFNSLAIEACIHKIPGLSNHYIYINDDFFIGDKIEKYDLLEFDGKRKVFKDRTSRHGDGGNLNNVYDHGLDYTHRLLNRLQQDEYRFKSLHTPYIHSKEDDRMKWKRFPEEFERTVASNFRDIYNVHDNSLFDIYWGLYHGTAAEAEIPHIYMTMTDDMGDNQRRLQLLNTKNPKTFCINDDIFEPDTDTGFVESFLRIKFPIPSPFEKI